MDEPIVLSNGDIRCHSCENTYERVGYHWSNGRCDYPDLPERKRALLTGMMLGDATLRTSTTYPFIQTYMTNKPFLEWLDDQLEWLSTGVSTYRTAEKSAQLARNNGNNVDADGEDYHDVYVMQTRTMPQFRLFEDWYDESDDGGREPKHFPGYIVLTPEIARMWYVSDGSLIYDRRYPNCRPYINIGVGSEVDNATNVERMFAESTFEHMPRFDSNAIRFSVDETEDFLDWIGPAPDGFQYKWSTDLDEYDRLRDEALVTTLST